MTDTLQSRLKVVRSTLRLGAGDMADRVGLKDRKSWERYERGQNVPKADILETLVGLGFSSEWLLTGEGPMRREPMSATQAAAEELLAAVRGARRDVNEGLGRTAVGSRPEIVDRIAYSGSALPEG